MNQETQSLSNLELNTDEAIWADIAWGSRMLVHYAGRIRSVWADLATNDLPHDRGKQLGHRPS